MWSIVALWIHPPIYVRNIGAVPAHDLHAIVTAGGEHDGIVQPIRPHTRLAQGDDPWVITPEVPWAYVIDGEPTPKLRGPLRVAIVYDRNQAATSDLGSDPSPPIVFPYMGDPPEGPTET